MYWMKQGCLIAYESTFNLSTGEFISHVKELVMVSENIF